jgi:2-polyprenyl-3-methyl-5-hydroxy-6-metoxy-1,4-benzoquinol methylase
VDRFDPTWARHWRAQYFINALKECNAHYILDVGSGAVYPTIFARAGFEVWAVDISQEALRQVQEIAKKWGVADKIKTLEQDATNLEKCATEGFDAVVQGELWEHMPDPAKVIREGLRVLKPGGYLIASTPCGMHHWDPMHLRTFDDNSIQELLKPWANQIKKLEKIAEGETEASCYLIVIQK